MRSWRNWQTRTVQVRVGNRGGSNPLDRTNKKQTGLYPVCFVMRADKNGDSNPTLAALAPPVSSLPLLSILPCQASLGEKGNARDRNLKVLQ